MMRRDQIRKIASHILFSVLLLYVTAMLLIACGDKKNLPAEPAESAGSQTESDEMIKIGFVVKENNRDYWIRMKAAAEQCCAENGAELIYLAGTNNAAAAEQIQEIDQLIEEKVDAVCISPVSDEMVYAAMKRAADAEIPLFSIDTDTAFSERTAYIGTDNYAAAKEGAIYAAGMIEGGGNAVILRGTLGDSVHDARTQGIAEGLSENGITTVRTLCTTPEDAGDDVQKLLGIYPDLDLLITTEDEITLAAWKRVMALGNTSVSLYGFDGTRKVASLTEADGQIIGTTAQFPEETGERAVQTVLKYLENGTAEDSVIIPYKIITPENAADYVEQLPADEEGEQQ